MSSVDLTQQFRSYVDYNVIQSSYWNPPSFMKSCNQALMEIDTLIMKVQELEKNISKNRLGRNKEQQSKMLTNVKQNIRICETHLKRINLMTPDMKTTDHGFVQEYKSSIVATLEMKLLQIGISFKNIFRKKNQIQNKSKSSQSSTTEPNLSRSHFLEQTQEEMMDEMATNQYKDIQNSIGQISQMYKETLSVVRMHEFMIDSITTNLDETQVNVEQGRKQLSEAHRRQSKNRPLIKKVFATLYILVFVYIVFLS